MKRPTTAQLPEADFLWVLRNAAAARMTVKLLDGSTGTLVYAPGGKPPKRSLRHGDPTQCGVRIKGHHRDRITAVPAEEIVEFLS